MIAAAYFVLALGTAARAQVTAYGWAGTVDSDWANTGNWRDGLVPGTGGGTNYGSLYITNNAGHALYYTAAQGQTILANTNTSTGSGRVLRIGADNNATGALYITGGILETLGTAGDLIGNTASSYGRLVVDGGIWKSNPDLVLFLGYLGDRAELIVNSGTARVGVVRGRNSNFGEITLNGGLLQWQRLERTGSINLTVNLNSGTLDHPRTKPIGFRREASRTTLAGPSWSTRPTKTWGWPATWPARAP